MKCWKCGRRIDENNAEWLCYPTMLPPAFAHAVCPPRVEPKPPLRLVAKHCRTCDTLCLGRAEALQGQHEDAQTGEVCSKPDFGPEVGVAEVPW